MKGHNNSFSGSHHAHFGELMKRFIIGVLLVFAAWQGYEQYQSRRFAKETTSASADANRFDKTFSAGRIAKQSTSYKCDGRVYCSQMTSCAEAKFFLANCPGVKMDGDNDGIPCERQWCN
jgi:hypothetical protein